MEQHAKIMEYAKAIVGLVGVVVTALLGVFGPADDMYDWLTAIAAVCTAIAVYAVPNATPLPSTPTYYEPEPPPVA
jgi:hypothetical protein